MKCCTSKSAPDTGGGQRLNVMSVVTLNEEDLDEEDLAILKEVKSKGYYHNRPKSEATAAPVRIDAPATPVPGGSRTQFDEFQKKWDKFDKEDFVKDLERQAPKSPPKPATTCTKIREEIQPQGGNGLMCLWNRFFQDGCCKRRSIGSAVA